MMHRYIKLSKWDEVLGTRDTGRKARDEIRDILEANGSVTISFDGVNVVSSSFADEAIARLMIDLGSERFRSSVHLIDASPRIKTVVMASIVIRDTMAESQSAATPVAR